MSFVQRPVGEGEVVVLHYFACGIGGGDDEDRDPPEVEQHERAVLFR